MSVRGFNIENQPTFRLVTHGPRTTGIIFGVLCVLPAAGLGAPSVALPALRTDLGVALGASSWVLASYSLGASVGMALFGQFLGRAGPRLILLLSSALLVAGAVLSGLAPGLGLIVAARLILGLAAAGVLICAYAAPATLPDTERPGALALIGAAVGIGSACGPLIGGLLVTALGWRAVLISPAVSLLLVPLALALLPRPDRSRPSQSFDWLGATLVTILGSAVVVLLESRATGLSGTIIAVLATAACGCVTGLFAIARRVSNPFIPPRLLRVPGFVAACFAGAASYAGYFALLYAGPLMLAAQGYHGIAIGLILLPAVIGSIAFSRISRAAGQRIGVPATVAFLGLLTAASVLAAGASAGIPAVVAIAIMTGISGFSGCQVVLLAAISKAVQPEDQSVANGLFNLAAFIGGALGPACVGAFAVRLPLDEALTVTAALPLIATLIAGLILFLRRRAALTTMRI